MCAKYGCGPTAGSKKLPFKFISRWWPETISNEAPWQRTKKDGSSVKSERSGAGQAIVTISIRKPRQRITRQALT